MNTGGFAGVDRARMFVGLPFVAELVDSKWKFDGFSLVIGLWVNHPFPRGKEPSSVRKDILYGHLAWGFLLWWIMAADSEAGAL